MQLYERQPAYLLYPFDRGWRIVAYVKDNVFSRTDAAAKFWYRYGEEYNTKASSSSSTWMKYWLMCCVGGFYLAGVSQYISAMVFVALFTAAQVIVLCVWAAMAVLLVGLLALATKAYSAWYRAFYRCPNCHDTMPIPTFICPECFTNHTRLWPSVYGIFSHSCNVCGKTRLPTLEWFGRRSIARTCPTCTSPLNADIGVLTNIHLPVVGGPSTGKSNFIVMATYGLIKNCQAAGRVSVNFPDPQHERDFQVNLGRLAGGRELLKTTSIVPQAYNLSFKRSGSPVGKIAYFYDAAGEAYSDETNTLQQKYFDYVQGIVLIVDPFSIATYTQEFQDQFDDVRLSLRPSSVGVQEAYERMLTVFETSVGLQRGKSFPHPLAVVVTKVDALGLEERIGAPAAERLVAQGGATSEAEAIDRLVRDFLTTYDLENFVRDVDLQFGKVRFFSCSALGRLPDPTNTRTFEPIRVLEPLAWVLDELDVIEAARDFQPAPAVSSAASATASGVV